VNIGGSGGVVAKREDYAGGGAASGSDAELESDGEFDPAPRIKGGKRGGQLVAPKRAKRKRTRTDANAETLRSAISEVCDIDLKGIINDEVFEQEFTAEEKDRLMLLLPEVDRRDPQTLAQCLRFNTHLNVAMQVGTAHLTHHAIRAHRTTPCAIPASARANSASRSVRTAIPTDSAGRAARGKR
jgi:hypothetical protein